MKPEPPVARSALSSRRSGPDDLTINATEAEDIVIQPPGEEVGPSERERAIARLAWDAGRRGFGWDALCTAMAITFGGPGDPEPTGLLPDLPPTEAP